MAVLVIADHDNATLKDNTHKVVTAAQAIGGDVDVLVAGGASDLDGIRRLRDTGIAGIILGEALLSGAIDLTAALEAAA